jgi:hypothetical protein
LLYTGSIKPDLLGKLDQWFSNNAWKKIKKNHIFGTKNLFTLILF